MNKRMGVLILCMSMLMSAVGRDSNGPETTEKVAYVTAEGFDTVDSFELTPSLGIYAFECSFDNDIKSFTESEADRLYVFAIMPIEHNCRELIDSIGKQPATCFTEIKADYTAPYVDDGTLQPLRC